MWRGIMRFASGLLLALGLYGQEYAATATIFVPAIAISGIQGTDGY